MIISKSNNRAEMTVIIDENDISAKVTPVRPMRDQYEGQTEVIPKKTAQILDTKGKEMRDDVIVYAVPYELVSNEADGYTVTIG